jgi:hypothetical protein
MKYITFEHLSIMNKHPHFLEPVVACFGFF